MNNNSWFKRNVLNTKLANAVLVAGVVIFIVVCVLAFAGCGANDTKVSGRDTAPAHVTNFPNHFSSVADKCDGQGHRIFEGDHGSSSNGGGGLAIINDPTCGGTR